MASTMVTEDSTSLPLHVLMVDGSADDVLLVTRTLRRGGYAPVCERVVTAEALLGALRGCDDWDIVLCDVVMPHLDVSCALSLARGVNPHVPVVVVSGYYAAELRDVLERSDVSGFVSKDHLDDLPDVVRGVLATTPPPPLRRGH